MNTGFQDLLERFTALGGIAENICQREGEYGRGIFPVDSSRRVKIMAPKNLLVNAANLRLDGNKVLIKDGNSFTTEEVSFLEMYWNDYSWGNNGNSDSSSFLNFIVSLPEPIKKQLVDNGFIDASLLSFREDNDCLLKRFVSERVVSFQGQSVLAPVWEFVNHNLFKYSGKNSSMSMWRKYGFACDCIVVYSIPFDINIGNQALAIRCSGQLGLDPKEKTSFSIVGNVIYIKSLPVGCLSVGLPQENLKSILSSVGLSADVANRLFPKILEANIKARRDLIDSLQEPGSGAKAQLYKALMCEIKLIESSSIG